MLAALRFAGASAAERGGQGVLSGIAYGVAVAAPGVVALTGRRGLVMIGAGVAGFGVAFLASFGVTLPLLVPAAMLLAQGMRDLGEGDGLRALLVAVAVPWAVVVLYAHDDPVTLELVSTSDVTVWWESLVSLGLSVVALLAGWHDRGDRGDRGDAEPGGVLDRRPGEPA